MNRNSISVFCSAVFAISLFGCVEQTGYVSKNESDQVSKLILEKAPAKIRHRVNADIDGKVLLLGYDLKPNKTALGEEFEVTWYWECKESPGAGWQLFTHMVDADGKSRINRDKVGPIRRHFQPEYWRPGLIIKDRQTIKVPTKWGSPTISLMVGLWKKNERMKINSGPSDKEGRIKGPTLEVVSHDEDNSVKAIIPRAPTAPKIDGEFEAEDVWKDALVLDDFTNTLTGERIGSATATRLMWDDDNLYVAMRAEDDYLLSKYTDHDDELWHEDAFEIFLDPGGDKKHYYEIQINPAGVVFDSYLPRYRKNTNAWSSGVVVKTETEGILNDSSGKDTGWTAEIAIPFTNLDKGGGVPPKSGDEWRVNFFRVNVTTDAPIYSAWSPPLRGDFHALDRFGSVVFSSGDATGAQVQKGDAGPQLKTGDAGIGTSEIPVKKSKVISRKTGKKGDK